VKVSHIDDGGEKGEPEKAGKKKRGSLTKNSHGKKGGGSAGAQIGRKNGTVGEGGGV